ncbi:MAG: YcgN family cysteine cluster protein [Oceanicaulis sp.]
MSDPRPFHERKSLTEMTREEWEQLCDGCGKCCVVLLQDEHDGTVWRTKVGCRLLDLKTVRCSDYANRHARVPGCVRLTPQNIGDLHWMPDTCAYRLIHEGRPLFDWHPLKSGDPDSVRKAGLGVHGALVSERDVDDEDLEDHIVEKG